MDTARLLDQNFFSSQFSSLKIIFAADKQNLSFLYIRSAVFSDGIIFILNLTSAAVNCTFVYFDKEKSVLYRMQASFLLVL